MTHLADGTLRRILDEPRAIAEADRAHLDTCAACRARADDIARDARAVAVLLAVPAATPDPTLALARVRAAAPGPGRLPFSVPRAPRWLAVAAAAVVVAFTLTTTGLADSFIQIFEPKQFVPVPITSSDLRVIPDLTAYGTMSWSGPGASQWTSGTQALVTNDVTAARSRSGLAVLMPADLPSNVDRATLQFRAVEAARMTFTFDAAKARAAAAKSGATAPAMPSTIDGSSLVVDVGPAVMQLYKVSGTSGDLSGLVVVEARPPVVSSSGPTIRELQDYLLAQPAISPALAAQVRALGDPQSMLPVPIPVDLASGRTVSVRGQPGLLVGDSTAVFSVVFWREGDVVRAVGGPLTDAEVLAIASSLR